MSIGEGSGHIPSAQPKQGFVDYAVLVFGAGIDPLMRAEWLALELPMRWCMLALADDVTIVKDYDALAQWYTYRVCLGDGYMETKITREEFEDCHSADWHLINRLAVLVEDHPQFGRAEGDRGARIATHRLLTMILGIV